MIETPHCLSVGCYYLPRQEQQDLPHGYGSYHTGHGATQTEVCMVFGDTSIAIP